MSFHYANRLEADYVAQIRIESLKERGWLIPGFTSKDLSWSRNDIETERVGLKIIIDDDEKYIELSYLFKLFSGKTEEVCTRVCLLTTSCNYGGFRYWFQCPHCLRQVGVLYSRGGYFACRHCQYLTYVSKNVSGTEKITGRIVSNQEIDSLRKKVKLKFYNGRITRAYKRFLKKKIRQNASVSASFESMK